jgi:hypothetical protein
MMPGMLPDLGTPLHASLRELVMSRFSGYRSVMDSLVTTGEVIDALGGTAAVARMLGRSMTVVSNWKAGGCFPSNTYVVFQLELSKLNAAAPDRLWRMIEPDLNPTSNHTAPKTMSISGRSVRCAR